MTATSDHYTLLGLPRSASSEEIRKAYFSAARRLHPDRNVAPGETEFFIEIQQAYEVLIDQEQRTRYDATLPPEELEVFPIQKNILFSRTSLLHLDEPQLIYALLDFSPVPSSQLKPAPPLNLCLVLDRSTSMQGMSMDVMKSTSIQILRRLRAQDILSVVTFSDRAEVLIPASRNGENSKLEARIQMLQTSGGTEIYQGLEMAFTEVQRNMGESRINHIILITDGRTYGDEKNCLTLAEKAASLGIGISGLGIGTEWNDIFLDELAKHTGGSSFYVSDPKQIQQLLIEKLTNLWQVFAEDVYLEFPKNDKIELRYAFRLKPEVGLLPTDSPIHMGPILNETSLTVLMEFSIAGPASQAETILLLDGKLNLSISTATTPPQPIQLQLLRPVSNHIESSPPPSEIVHALSRLSLYRLQEQARLDINSGLYDKASERLNRLASHLLAHGETELAHTVILEAKNILDSRSISKEGEKRIKYGTRALLLSGQEKKP